MVGMAGLLFGMFMWVLMYGWVWCYRWLLQLFVSERPTGFMGRRPAFNAYLVSQRPFKNQRKPDWVRAELIRLAALSGGSRRSVTRLFNRLHGARYGETVSTSFTCDFLKAHAIQVLRLRRELQAKKPRVVSVCHTWAMDLTFFTDDAKQTHASFGIIDHGSRVLLCLRTLTVRNSWTLLGYLCLTIGRYGKPQKLRTDNEAVFNSWVFRTFLKRVGIQKQTTNVHSPWQNGRIERVFGTLKPVLRQLHINGKVQLQNALDEFQLFYNHARPHTNLNNQTPAEVWRSQCFIRKPKQRSSKSEPVIIQAFDGLMTGVYEPPD